MEGIHAGITGEERNAQKGIGGQKLSARFDLSGKA